jgi:transcription termination factor Rho
MNRVAALMAVIHKKELEASPLADLHAIAAELGLEGFRGMRRDDLIAAILGAQGDEGEDEREPDEVTADESLEAPSGVVVAPEEEEPDAIAEEVAAPPPAEEEPEVVEDEVSDEEIATGVLDILANGSGFLRLDPVEQSRDDVYVSPAQIRRCELRAGDEVSGPARPPRRNERHPSLVRVEQVNGAEAEPPEERAWFGELTAVFPSERLSGPPALDAVPFGRGSRVAVSGPAGAGATTLLQELAATLAERHPELALQVVMAGVRPEEVGEWRERAVPAVGGSFERSQEAQAQAAELAVERAKRQVERGGHAALIVDALDALPPGVRRRVFGAARATQEGGTLTVVAATGEDSEALRWASTRVILEPGGRVSGQSASLRAERLA